MGLLATTALAALLICISPVRADEVLFVDTDIVREKFETSLTIIKEHLEAQSPPRYHLHIAEIEFAVTTGADGGVEGKIPIGVVNVSFDGEYGQVHTTRQSYSYVPRDSIPTNFDDLGVAAFLVKLQEDIADKYRTADFVPSRATRSEEFVVAMNGEGKLEFFAVAALRASVQIKNSHKATYKFCLLGNDGNCTGE